METPTHQSSDSSHSEDGKHNMDIEENKDTGGRKTRERSPSTWEAATTAQLIRAFGAANIPLQSLNNRGLMEHFQANVRDPLASSSSDQLKRCYQKFMSDTIELDLPTFCSVKSCITWSHSHTEHKYAIFPFPDCKESIKLWKQALNLTQARKGHGVCELHFDEAFLIRDGEGDQGITLMPGAIPQDTPEPVKVLLSTKHCRMCGLSAKGPTVYSVAELHRERRLQPILEMCLQLNDLKYSCLPDTACEGCVKMVRFVGNFAETCWNAQQRLMRLYSGTGRKKGQPRKRRRRQRLDEPQDEDVEEHTESSDSPVSEHVFMTAEEQVSEIEAEQVPQEEVPMKFEPDGNASVKPEPLDSGNSLTINDENVPEATNLQADDEQKKPTPKLPTIGMRSGRSWKYECRTCWQRLASQVELNIHTEKHERERKAGKSSAEAVLSGWSIGTIKCLQCRKTFGNPEELKAHTAQEHKAETYCPVCGMRFRNNDVLEQHRKRKRRCMVPEAAGTQ